MHPAARDGSPDTCTTLGAGSEEKKLGWAEDAHTGKFSGCC